uniref:A20-type domain-containing protein n=1 Tax=Hucho hucho TaxID=62062 RepID=A0A4W5RQM3_9TELE
MGDTGSERSKPLPTRCPCGFWGSSKTMNLCSKCFADIEKKQTDEDCAPKPSPSTGSTQSAVFNSEMSSSSKSSQSLLSSPLTSSEQPSASTEDPVPMLSTTQEELLSCTETAQGTLCTPKKRPCESGTALLLLPVCLCNTVHWTRTPCNLLFFQLQGRRARRHRINGHGGTLGRRLARSLAEDPSRKTAGAAIAAKPNWSWYSRNWAPVAAATCSACCTVYLSSTTASSTTWGAGARRPSSRW